MHQERTYRNLLTQDRLIAFRVIVQETDLHVQACTQLSALAKESVLQHRLTIESFIQQHPDFGTAMTPIQISTPAPDIITDMLGAGTQCGVGPMAAVAGAMAEYVGHDLLNYSSEIIVENGGDIFIQTARPMTIGIFAHRSPLSMRMGLKINERGRPISVCTSSGTVGHSHSFGRADAVTVVSRACPLADAAATAIGNRVKHRSDLKHAIEFGKQIKGVKGFVIIKDDQAGIWGDLEVTRL